MRIIQLFFLLALVSFELYAKDEVKYPVSQIPEELKAGADIVYREFRSTFTIFAKDKARYHKFVVITILNERGKDAANLYAHYDNLSRVNSISGNIYDKEGKLARKLKPSEIADYSATGSSLYSDNRVKMANLNYPTYPYTLEFESEVDYSYLFYIPSWEAIPGERASVQKNSFTLEYEMGVKPRFKQKNIEFEAIQSMKGGRESLTWTVVNLPAKEREPVGPPFEETIPRILFAPGNFAYSGYEGNMNDWNSFGKWIHTLNEGRNKLPEETKQMIAKLTRDLPSDEEKIKAVYRYLQNKTRYVSVQIEIGGYQPFPAEEVDSKSYGDCKALSNYTVALLKAAGVKANYVLILAGDEEDFDTTFPSTQFNHATVAVPNAKDTIWLECTSQISPFGYAGTFTGDRHALMITDDGAAIVKTPTYPAGVNKQERQATIVMGLDGSGTAHAETTYSGIQFENGHLDYYMTMGADGQKKWLLNSMSIPSFEVKNFSIDAKGDRIPQATVKVNLDIRSMGTITGKRFFVNPNLMNSSLDIPKKLEKRETIIEIRTGYVDKDSIILKFPEELHAEFVPAKVHFVSKFGSYDATYKLEAGQLVYVRKLRMNKGKFSPESYQEYIDFCKNINKADNTKVVFVNKT